MENKSDIVIQHPVFGHVIFPNPSLRQREILEDYNLTKKTMKQMQPFIQANVQSFNGMAKDRIVEVLKKIKPKGNGSKGKRR